VPKSKLIALLDDESTWTQAVDDPMRWMPVHILLALGRRESKEAGSAIVRALCGSGKKYKKCCLGSS
jgi:hypothetical protein